MPTKTTRPALTLAGSLLTLFGLCGTSAAQHVGTYQGVEQPGNQLA